MSIKKLNLRKPLYSVTDGSRMDIIHEFPNGNLVVAKFGGNFAATIDRYGYNIAPTNRPELRKQRVVNKLPETVEYVTLYPNGQAYTKSCCPVRSSSYGVENLIQVKVTRRAGKIVKKEIVE